MKRVNLGKALPTAYEAVFNLNKTIDEAVTAAGISKGFSHLLLLRASQINQCAFCLRMHTRDALEAGESNDRISVLGAWRETEYFDEKERACLALVEAMTTISIGQISDAVYAEAAETLSDQEIAAVEWLGIAINIWNRIAIASRYPVAEPQSPPD